jgi:hypothetical protein
MPSDKLFQLYHGESKLFFWNDDDEVSFILDQHASVY